MSQGYQVCQLLLCDSITLYALSTAELGKGFGWNMPVVPWLKTEPGVQWNQGWGTMVLLLYAWSLWFYKCNNEDGWDNLPKTAVKEYCLQAVSWPSTAWRNVKVLPTVTLLGPDKYLKVWPDPAHGTLDHPNGFCFGKYNPKTSPGLTFIISSKRLMGTSWKRSWRGAKKVCPTRVYVLE